MKKQLMKRILSAGLALVMAAGLCACGKKDDGRENANEALAKEHVYRVKSVELSGLSDLADVENSWFVIQGSAYSEGRIHAVLKILNGYDNAKAYYVLTVDGLDRPEGVDKDGGDFWACALERPEDVPERPDYDHFAVAEDGTVFAVCRYMDSREDVVTGEVLEEERSRVCCWNVDGSLRWRSELREPEDRAKEGETLYVMESWVSADGVLNLLFSGDNAYKLCVGSEGAAQEMVKLSDKTAEVFANSQALLPAADGSLQVVYSDENDWTIGWLAEYDVSTDTFEEPGKMPEGFIWNGYDMILAGSDSDLIYADISGVYRYNRGETQGQPMMNYINSDRNITSLCAVTELGRDRFFAGQKSAKEVAALIQNRVQLYVQANR